MQYYRSTNVGLNNGFPIESALLPEISGTRSEFLKGEWQWQRNVVQIRAHNHEPSRHWTTKFRCDAWRVPRQTRGYYPNCGASPPLRPLLLDSKYY